MVNQSGKVKGESGNTEHGEPGGEISCYFLILYPPRGANIQNGGKRGGETLNRQQNVIAERLETFQSLTTFK